MVQLLKVLCPESETTKTLTCNCTKATIIVTNNIGKYNYNEVLKKIAVQKFSLLIDESTDKGSIKHLAIVARMVNNSSLKVRDEFVSLIPVSNATAQNIFDVLINFFNSNNIPYKTN